MRMRRHCWSEIKFLGDLLWSDRRQKAENLDEEIEALIENGRKPEKPAISNWQMRSGDQLLAQGIILEDTREGVNGRELKLPGKNYFSWRILMCADIRRRHWLISVTAFMTF